MAPSGISISRTVLLVISILILVEAKEDSREQYLYDDPKLDPKLLEDNFHCDELQRFMSELIVGQQSHVFKEDAELPPKFKQTRYYMEMATNGEGHTDFKVTNSISFRFDRQILDLEVKMNLKKENINRIKNELAEPNVSPLDKLRLKYLLWKFEREKSNITQSEEQLRELYLAQSYAWYYEAEASYRNYKVIKALSNIQDVKVYRAEHPGVAMGPVLDLERRSFLKLIEFCDKEPRLILQLGKKKYLRDICEYHFTVLMTQIKEHWGEYEKLRNLIRRAIIHSYKQCAAHAVKWKKEDAAFEIMKEIDLYELAILDREHYSEERSKEARRVKEERKKIKKEKRLKEKRERRERREKKKRERIEKEKRERVEKGEEERIQRSEKETDSKQHGQLQEIEGAGSVQKEGGEG